MIASELEWDKKLNKINILHRPSLRGLKKCKSCGSINGMRSTICRNGNCDLRKSMLAAIKPFDPIQLITYNETRLFSLRTKEKLTHVRNFVGITGSASKGGVCYVDSDSCRYDPNGMAPTGCRHVKAVCSVENDFHQAEMYPVDKGILWNLNISEEQKYHLWDLYRSGENEIHPIQRLNASTFVVACVNSKNFPAGRLHVTVCANSVANKKGFYLCACKKLKIIVEPDNSVTMKKEICDHLLLLLAAILNRPEGKAMYGVFLDSLQHLWMPTTLNPPVDSSSPLMDFDLSLVKCEDSCDVDSVGAHNSEDLFSFSEELFADNNIPDFSDIILDVTSGNQSSLSSTLQPQSIDSISTSVLHSKDANLNASINDEDLDLNFTHIEATTSRSPSPSMPAVPISFNENSLSVIEQFQLNDNIHVSNESYALAKDIEILNNLESQVTQTTWQDHDHSHNQPLTAAHIKQESLLKPQPQQPMLTNETNSVIIKSKCNQVFLNKSVIVKQSPVKIIKITTPGVIQKLPKIDKKFVQISKIDSSKIFVLNSRCSDRPLKIQPLSNLNVTSTVPSPPLMMDAASPQTTSTMPSLSYESWLDNIIEILNDSIILQDSNNIKHTFHVHEDIFSHFSKTFGFNNRRRLPNFTSLIKGGKHKGLIKYGWYFNQAAAVKRIFSTKNSKLELQRSSEPLKDGSFVPFFPKIPSEITVTKFRPIQRKEPEHKVFIKFSNAPETALDNHQEVSKCFFKFAEEEKNTVVYFMKCEKSGLRLEWLPSAFPRSHFGLMTIEFCVYTYTKNGYQDGNS